MYTVRQILVTYMYVEEPTIERLYESGKGGELQWVLGNNIDAQYILHTLNKHNNKDYVSYHVVDHKGVYLLYCTVAPIKTISCMELISDTFSNLMKRTSRLVMTKYEDNASGETEKLLDSPVSTYYTAYDVPGTPL